MSIKNHLPIYDNAIEQNKTEELIAQFTDSLLSGRSKLLSSGDTNTKLAKNSVYTLGLSLAPASLAGVGNLCPHASAGCRASCLYYCGQGGLQSVQAARIARTRLLFSDRQWYLDKLRAELTRAVNRCAKLGEDLAVRLNVLSDYPWETTGIIDEFETVNFYDYTKNPRRAGLVRPNYWVTFSRSETNEQTCLDVLASGANVAIAFADQNRPWVGNRAKFQRLPKSWNTFKVIDGDTTDLRYLDSRGKRAGHVIGLRLKAKSYADRQKGLDSGFAILWG